jgi:hypothetical protein
MRSDLGGTRQRRIYDERLKDTVFDNFMVVLTLEGKLKLNWDEAQKNVFFGFIIIIIIYFLNPRISESVIDLSEREVR